MNEDILQYLEEQEANDEACHEEVLALAEIRRLRAALEELYIAVHAFLDVDAKEIRVNAALSAAFQAMHHAE